MGFNRRDNDRRGGGGRSFGGGGNRRSFGGGGRSFGGGGRGRDGGDREMHSAICDNCGKECQVPFKPTSGKPVLCNDCFGKSDRSNRSDRGSRGNSGGDSRKVLDKISALESKMDKILVLLGEKSQSETEERSQPEVEEKPKKKASKPKPTKSTEQTIEPQVTAPDSVETTETAPEVPVEMPESEA